MEKSENLGILIKKKIQPAACQLISENRQTFLKKKVKLYDINTVKVERLTLEYIEIFCGERVNFRHMALLQHLFVIGGAPCGMSFLVSCYKSSCKHFVVTLSDWWCCHLVWLSQFVFGPSRRNRSPFWWWILDKMHKFLGQWDIVSNINAL